MDNNTYMRVLLNVHTLLNNRGHNVQQLNERLPLNFLIDKINRFSKDNTSLDIYISGPSKVYVKFLKDLTSKPAAGIKHLEKIYNIISDAYRFNRDDEFIFVVFDDVNSEINGIENIYPNITLFGYKKLLVNIVDNVYVPKHTKLNKQDRLALKDNLMINNYNDLPILYKSDAISRYYNFREGDVIKIERPSLGNKTHIVYRYIISDDFVNINTTSGTN